MNPSICVDNRHTDIRHIGCGE